MLAALGHHLQVRLPPELQHEHAPSISRTQGTVKEEQKDYIDPAGHLMKAEHLGSNT